MYNMKCLLLLLFAVIAVVYGDVYMHNPRGSNNRLNEKSANRQNANRGFDSQNNNRGGYNVGDSTHEAASNEAEQYNMKYFMSGNYKQYTDNDGELTGEGISQLVIEWTNQHGCGGNEDSDPHKLNCHVVIQYMCQQTDSFGNNNKERLRDGIRTETQKHTRINNLQENKQQATTRRNNDVDIEEFLQESWYWYDKCYNRERNAGLFTADQSLKQDNGNGYSSAIYTRQNPNGNRRGYECPEERDYYPYWHPSPWKDAAILVDDEDQCEYYQSESYNVKPKYECVEEYGNGGDRKHWSRWNNRADCEENGGDWLEFTNYLEKHPDADNKNDCLQASGNGKTYVWGIPEGEKDPTCLLALDPPDCMRAPWTRVNHLGNTRGRDASRYNWTIPYFPSGKEQTCALRLRYNISTDDYDPMNTDSNQNQDIVFGIQSPVQQNPYVNIAADNQPLRLAINTAQYGRTFQDRSHVFKIVPRPDGEDIDAARIYNLNVRGKRGNIVQVYPAVEYDFIPNDLYMKAGDLVHVQWTGSNTHNNGNPGGDGQTGDAGEGRGGTDRSNIVEILSLNDNYPVLIENAKMWQDTEVVWIYHGETGRQTTDLAVNMASSGYYECMEAAVCQGKSAETKDQLNNLLDNAPASYEGTLLKFAPGRYYYMGSRNNNFSNRSQKGTITVRER